MIENVFKQFYEVFYYERSLTTCLATFAKASLKSNDIFIGGLFINIYIKTVNFRESVASRVVFDIIVMLLRRSNKKIMNFLY